MGTFGYGPFDNDDALDWLGILELARTPQEVYGWVGKHLDIARSDAFAGYHEARAAARYAYLFAMQPLLKSAELSLQVLCLHERWHQDWIDPKKIHVELERERKQLLELICRPSMYKQFDKDAKRLANRVRSMHRKFTRSLGKKHVEDTPSTGGTPT